MSKKGLGRLGNTPVTQFTTIWNNLELFKNLISLRDSSPLSKDLITVYCKYISVFSYYNFNLTIYIVNILIILSIEVDQRERPKNYKYYYYYLNQ